MRRKVAVVLLMLHLVLNTELHEFVKLPFLFSHFKEHKSTNENLSFIDFLSIHYAQPTVIDDDYERDMKLPFKSHPEMALGIDVTALKPEMYQWQLGVHLMHVLHKPIMEPCDYYFNFSFSVWQPPKIT